MVECGGGIYLFRCGGGYEAREKVFYKIWPVENTSVSQHVRYNWGGSSSCLMSYATVKDFDSSLWVSDSSAKI